MSKNSSKTPTDPDLLASLNALQRAAQRAREIAIQTGTPLVVYHNGKIVDALAQEKENKT